jgi:hypothetical protein
VGLPPLSPALSLRVLGCNIYFIPVPDNPNQKVIAAVRKERISFIYRTNLHLSEISSLSKRKPNF